MRNSSCHVLVYRGYRIHMDDRICKILSMQPDERIRMLYAQLVRARNPEVIKIVVDELRIAIDAYRLVIVSKQNALIKTA
jgi:hypothetical protein